MFLVENSGSRGGLWSIRRISISDLNANVKMLAFTDGTCFYIMLLPLGFMFAEFIAKRIHVKCIYVNLPNSRDPSGD